MKKIISLLLIIITTAGLFVSCAKTPPGNTDGIIGDTMSGDDAAADSITPPELPEFPINEPLIPFNEPEEPETLLKNPPPFLPDYIPGENIFPLSNSASIYTYIIPGPVNFINREYKLVDMPENVIDYYRVSYYNRETESLVKQCYCLYDKDWKFAVMNMDGKFITDFIYDVYIDFEFPGGFANKGYLAVGKMVSDKRYYQKWGLLDLRTGKEVIPLIYDSMDLYDNYILVEYNGEKKLIDYKGNTLFDFGKDDVNIHTAGGGSYNGGLYNLNTVDNTIYIRDIEDGVNIIVYDNYYVLTKNVDNNKMISVYDLDKNHVMSVYAYNYSQDSNGNLLIDDKINKIIYVVTENTVKRFKYFYQYVRNPRYVNENLIFESDDYEYTVIIDQSGNIIFQEPYQNPDDDPDRYWDTTYGDITCRYHYAESTEVFDKNGNTLIPRGKYLYSELA